jgi:hypothetical protein
VGRIPKLNSSAQGLEFPKRPVPFHDQCITSPPLANCPRSSEVVTGCPSGSTNRGRPATPSCKTPAERVCASPWSMHATDPVAIDNVDLAAVEPCGGFRGHLPVWKTPPSEDNSIFDHSRLILKPTNTRGTAPGRRIGRPCRAMPRGLSIRAGRPNKLQEKVGLQPSGTRYMELLAGRGTIYCAEEADAALFPRPARVSSEAETNR